MDREDYLPFGKPNFSDDEIASVTRVLRSGWVGMGQETIYFEKELAVYLEAPAVVTVNSCTSALFLSLLVHGIGPGGIRDRN
ncbi:DegT/DnrJ/EryC1/StrS family aminotransferase [Thermodesulfobacteriota bacterium]